MFTARYGLDLFVWYILLLLLRRVMDRHLLVSTILAALYRVLQ